MLAFELANRAYFARSIGDRGDEFFARFADEHRELLAEQAAGTCRFHVLVEGDGEVTGRFNLYDLADHSAEVGYRVAERVAGRGVATRAVADLCDLARERYGLRRLTASVSDANIASRTVLLKVGFVAVTAREVGGRPGSAYTVTLSPDDAAPPTGI